MNWLTPTSIFHLFAYGAAIAIIVILKFKTDALQQEVTVYREAAEANAKALAEAKSELIHMDNVLLEREAELNAIEDKADVLSQRLCKAIEKGQAADWANTALPDDIARLLSGADSPNGNNQDEPAANTTPAATRSEVGGKDK